MTRAVLFGIDGTLVDSVDWQAKAWQEAFKRFGYEISVPQIRQQIGKGSDQLIATLLPEDAAAQYGVGLEKYRRMLYQQQYLPQVKAFPGTRALCEHLRAHGQRIALASSTRGAEVATYKRLADIVDLVDVEVIADDVEQAKPYPDIFLAALERLSLGPEEAMVVGASPYDAEAASQAGLRTIGLLCGGFPEAVLRQAGCLAIYQDPAELLTCYATSPLANA